MPGVCTPGAEEPIKIEKQNVLLTFLLVLNHLLRYLCLKGLIERELYYEGVEKKLFDTNLRTCRFIHTDN